MNRLKTNYDRACVTTCLAARSASFATRPLVLALMFATALALTLLPAGAADDSPPVFREIPTQYIAALGDPGASSGRGAQHWGLWRRDPGPRGVWLKDFDRLQAASGVAPARWQFDRGDWWLDENGLIMEQPDFPLPPGRYIVTGGRETVAMLTVHPEDSNGDRRWQLNRDATLHDVTHLACRSARYTPAADAASCSPQSAPRDAFKVPAGAAMPPVDGCSKQDYHVLLVIAVAADS